MRVAIEYAHKGYCRCSAGEGLCKWHFAWGQQKPLSFVLVELKVLFIVGMSSHLYYPFARKYECIYSQRCKLPYHCSAGYLLCAFRKYPSSGETVLCSFNEFTYKFNKQCPQKCSRRCRCRISKNFVDYSGTLHIFLYIMNTE